MTATLSNASVNHHPVVNRDQWLAQRKALLDQEKALSRQTDELARQRRALPWVRVDQAYVFDTPQGRRTLAELFEGRSQLLVQHFMFGPGWEQGCPSCSFMADHLDGMRPHLAQRDLAVCVVSRAPLDQIQRFQQRMGWRFPWASSHGSSFNFDFCVSFEVRASDQGEVYYNYAMRAFPQTEAPGLSVFVKDTTGTVFHAYSTYGRGVEAMMGTYPLLDLTPKGRDEDALPYTMAWVKHHDRYEPAATATASKVSGCCASHA
jgi:predicted dithiol-disulfide oxidoreductase (DUF899 family)